MPKRGIFEVLKDTLVGVLRALREFIESVWYGKEYDKIQQEKIIEQIKTNKALTNEDKAAKEKLVDVIKERNDKYKEKEIEKGYRDSNRIIKSLDTPSKDIAPPQPFLVVPDFNSHINALEHNAFQIVSSNIDNIFEKPQQYQCETNGQTYLIETTNKSDNAASVKVSCGNKAVVSFDVEITNDTLGNKTLEKTNSKHHIQALSELNIIDSQKNPQMDTEEFKKGLIAKAMEEIQKNNKFFEYNGHIFDARINQANQCIVYYSETNKFVLKSALNNSGIQKFHENKDLVNLLSYKGNKKLPSGIDSKEMFKSVLKECGITEVEVKDHKIKIKLPNNEDVVLNRSNYYKQYFDTIIADTSKRALVLNYINNYFKSSNEKSSQSNIFSINKLKDLLAENNKDKIKEEIEKIKKISDFKLAKNLIKENGGEHKKELLTFIHNKQKDMENAVFNLLSSTSKTTDANIENQIKELISSYDDVDTLNDVKNAVLKNENISDANKEKFILLCLNELPKITNNQSKIVFDDQLTTSKLIEYSSHLDKNVAAKAQEEINKIIHESSGFVLNCAFSNKQEELETRFSEVVSRIDDEKTFEEFKAVVQKECFMGDSMQEKYSQLCNIKENDLGIAQKETPQIDTDDMSL